MIARPHFTAPIVLFLGLALACGGGGDEGGSADETPSEPAGPRTANVAMQGGGYAQAYVFDPATVTIRAGDRVSWLNVSDTVHTATADDGSWNSLPMDDNEVYTRTFDEPGEYLYYCIYHGGKNGQGMAAKVIVQ